MQPITQVLDASLLASSATSSTTSSFSSSGTPLDIKSSDGRLELVIPPGSLDRSQATVSTSTCTNVTAGPVPYPIAP